MRKFSFTLHYDDGKYEDVIIFGVQDAVVMAANSEQDTLFTIQLNDGKVCKQRSNARCEILFTRKSDIDAIRKRVAEEVSYLPKQQETYLNRNIKFLSYVTELDEFGKYSLSPINVLESEGVLDTPHKVNRFCKTNLHLQSATEEYVYLLAMDSKCAPVALFELNHGTVNSSLISPREIFIKALLVGAVNFLIVHNHVSGDETPSKEDRYMTELVLKGAQLIGLNFVDSIILGQSYYSFCEEGFFIKNA